MYIGNHCVLYGGRIATEAKDILSQLSKGGCHGVEIGKRFFGGDNRQELLDMLGETGLKLGAYHVNSLLTDVLDKPETVRAMFLEAGEFLQAFPVKNILYTPIPGGENNTPSTWDQRLLDKEEVKKIARFLESVSLELREKDVQLHLHNHNWEFMNDGLLFFTIADHAPHLNLGLDVGWVYAGGYDAMEIVRRYRDQITYCHVRDLQFDKIGTYSDFQSVHDDIFVDLGEGDAPLDKLLPLLRDTVGEDGWLTVEYEVGEQDAARYHRATAYVKNVLGLD